MARSESGFNSAVGPSDRFGRPPTAQAYDGIAGPDGGVAICGEPDTGSGPAQWTARDPTRPESCPFALPNVAVRAVVAGGQGARSANRSPSSVTGATSDRPGGNALPPGGGASQVTSRPTTGPPGLSRRRFLSGAHAAGTSPPPRGCLRRTLSWLLVRHATSPPLRRRPAFAICGRQVRPPAALSQINAAADRSRLCSQDRAARSVWTTATAVLPSYSDRQGIRP